jgi:hypothetical protein
MPHLHACAVTDRSFSRTSSRSTISIDRPASHAASTFSIILPAASDDDGIVGDHVTRVLLLPRIACVGGVRGKASAADRRRLPPLRGSPYGACRCCYVVVVDGGGLTATNGRRRRRALSATGGGGFDYGVEQLSRWWSTGTDVRQRRGEPAAAAAVRPEQEGARVEAARARAWLLRGNEFAWPMRAVRARALLTGGEGMVNGV